MKYGETALIWASTIGHLDAVNRLLDCKYIDIHVQNKVSGILIVLHPHQPSIILFFIVFGCVFFNSNLIDAKNMQDGKTALILATQEGHLDVVNRLLDCRQIDVNMQLKVN